jgi:hypothetical protein
MGSCIFKLPIPPVNVKDLITLAGDTLENYKVAPPEVYPVEIQFINVVLTTSRVVCVPDAKLSKF